LSDMPIGSAGLGLDATGGLMPNPASEDAHEKAGGPVSGNRPL